MTEPIAVSVAEAAQALGISRTDMYQLVQSGRVDARKHGTRWLVSYASLQDYFASLGRSA